LPGEPDAVATVAVARHEDIRGRLEAVDLRAKISVGLLTVDRLRPRETLVPHQLRIRPFIGLQGNLPFVALIVLRAACKDPKPLDEPEQPEPGVSEV